MPLVVLIILIGIPVIELTVLVEVAEDIGAFNTVILSILTAVIGVGLVKQQGIQVVQNMQKSVNEGGSPMREAVHGFFLFFAGLFLLFPGFITDGLGAMLLLPPIRNAIVNLGFLKVITTGGSNNGPHGFHRGPDRPSSGYSVNDENIIIDGEFREESSPSNDNEETDKKD